MNLITAVQLRGFVSISFFFLSFSGPCAVETGAVSAKYVFYFVVFCVLGIVL